MEGETRVQVDPLVERVRAVAGRLGAIEQDPQWLPATALAAAFLHERLDAWLRARGATGDESPLGPLQGSDPPELDVSAIAAREIEHRGPGSATPLEIIRDVLVFVPVGLTWYHLSQAFDGYAETVTTAQDAKEPVPTFLVAWQNGEAGKTTFSSVAWQVVGCVILIAVLSILASMARRRGERNAQQAVSDLCATFDEAQVVLAWIGADRELVASEIAYSAVQVAGTMRSVDRRIGRAVEQLERATKAAETANEAMQQDLDSLNEAADDLVDRSAIESEAVRSSQAAAESAAAAAKAAEDASVTVDSLVAIVNQMLVDWTATRRSERERMQEINAQVGDFARLLQATEALQGRISTLHPDLYACPRCKATVADQHARAAHDEADR